MATKYAIVIEKAGKNYSAYVPDLPGCVATGATKTETARHIKEAIQFHIEGLHEDGLAIPKPSCTVRWVSMQKNGRLQTRARAKGRPPGPRPKRKSR